MIILKYCFNIAAHFNRLSIEQKNLFTAADNRQDGLNKERQPNKLNDYHSKIFILTDILIVLCYQLLTLKFEISGHLLVPALPFIISGATNKIRMQEEKTFQPNDKVFAKVRGHMTWPAKIIGKVENSKRYGQFYIVQFYGTHETAKVTSRFIYDYLANKSVLKKTTFDNSKHSKYRKAFIEIEEEISRDCIDGNGEFNPSVAEKDEIIGADRMQMVPVYYFHALILYAAYIKQYHVDFKHRMPELLRNAHENVAKVLVLKYKEQYIGYRYLPQDLANFANEYERAIDDELKAEAALAWKLNIEAGNEINLSLPNTLVNLQIDDKIFSNLNQVFMQDYVNEVYYESESLFKCINGIIRGINLRDLQIVYDYLVEVTEHVHDKFLLVKDVRLFKILVAIIYADEWNAAFLQSINDRQKLNNVYELALNVFESMMQTFDCTNAEEFYAIYWHDVRNYQIMVADSRIHTLLIAERGSRKQIMHTIYQQLHEVDFEYP